MPIQIADKPTLDLVKAKTDLIGLANPETGGTDELFKYLKLLHDLIGAASPSTAGVTDLFKYFKRLEENLCMTCTASTTSQLTLIASEGIYGYSNPFGPNSYVVPYTGTVNINMTIKKTAHADGATYIAESYFGKPGVEGVVTLETKSGILPSYETYTAHVVPLRVVAGCIIKLSLSGSIIDQLYKQYEHRI